MIQIACRLRAVEIVLKEQNKWNVLSIRDANSGKYPIDCVKDLCKDILILRFDDVLPSDGCGVCARIEDVEEVLEWSKDKEDILCHCNAGISRSSAMAFLIACTRMKPEEAVKILEYKFHFPNVHIISLGMKFFPNNEEIIQVFLKWQKQAIEFVKKLLEDEKKP